MVPVVTVPTAYTGDRCHWPKSSGVVPSNPVLLSSVPEVGGCVDHRDLSAPSPGVVDLRLSPSIMLSCGCM